MPIILDEYEIIYDVKLSKRAEKDRAFWLKNSKIIYSRIMRIIDELKVHPRTGIGKPEPLKNIKNGWSRRLDEGNRIEYRIIDKEVRVDVVSARGHYDDH